MLEKKPSHFYYFNYKREIFHIETLAETEISASLSGPNDHYIFKRQQ